MYHLKLEQFETTDNLLLPGLLYEPEKKTNAVAIYLHGNGSSSVFYSVDKMNTIAEELTKQNIAFFPFNNRGAHYIKSLYQKKGDEEERMMYGTAYELIKECIYDIDGAIDYLKKLGYKTFYLIGISTGANKIILYHYYKPKNSVSKYILLSGGDDTGLYYQEMGKKKFYLALKKAKEAIKKGHGTKLIPKYLVNYWFSYQALYDTLNPNGDYNIFPFNEYINNLKLSKKPLFKEYKTIDKPTLVVYGEFDEFCYGKVPECVEILKKETTHLEKFTFKIIPNADHGFTDKEKELAGIVASWLAK